MTSQLRKINNVIEQFLLPLAEAVSGWSTLAAIRSALIVTLPLMFLGSLAELLISFPLDAYKEFMFRQFGPEWRMFGQILKDATFSVMSLIMVFSIGHHLADQFNHDNPVLRANPVIAGLLFHQTAAPAFAGGDSRYRHPADLQRLHPRHVDRARVRGPWRGHADICGHVSA